MPNAHTQGRHGYKYKRENLYSAIIVCMFDGVPRPVCLKYHNIAADRPATKEKFLTFARSFDGARHVNFYTGVTKVFHEQVKL